MGRGEMNAAMLSATETASVRGLLRLLPARDGGEGPWDPDLERALRALLAQADAEWQERPPTVVSSGPEDALGLVLVRRRRQLAYSLKLSNLGRDPFASLPALAFTATASVAAPTLVAAPPPTFPSFLLSIALVWLRAFAQPIGYGEAALLHYINQVSALRGTATAADMQDVGEILVSTYGYVKGQNGNEVASLLSSLLAWKAIEEFEGGYRARETVPFGFGPIEYAS